MNEPQWIEPLLSSEEREELAGIAYFLAQCETLQARGLITEEARLTIADEYTARRDAIESRGRCEAAMAAARRLVARSPSEAIPWADRARQLDPDRPEAWVLAIEARKGWRDDEAQAVAAEAVARFPGFPLTPADLQHERAVRQAQAESQREQASTADLLAKARAALDLQRDEDVIAHTDALLERQPDLFDAQVLRAFSLQRLGRLDEALTAYRQLQARQPHVPAWAQWVHNIEGRLARISKTRPKPVADRPVTPAPTSPAISWKSITGEFLEDHWQKLILCLAVLLIVVSSNVGAYQLLGPRLWSPAGKCILALVYTAMFAALGSGLVRWGAARAGRMMLVTTLILVPFDFMLAGGMRLLTDPSPGRLVVLVLDAGALGVLIWRVVRMLRLPRGGGATLLAALFALSATNVMVAPGVGWPLAAFFLPSALFMGAVWRINSREPDPDAAVELDFIAIALGVLAFAFFATTLRSGIAELNLAPTLFGVPVMLAAIAAVHTSHHLARRSADPQWVQGLRFGGIVLSGLAFALALARPPGLSPLYSGNTLAVALLGLGLYAGSLRAYRQPAYLYFCFGALFLAYFGAFYFMRDLIHSVEKVVGGLLGYKEKLPMPFKSINGLVFSSVLAGLSIFFKTRWKDLRLARHANYIGVPFSIAACVFSGFEPKAALICLSGYAVVYAIGADLFARPWVVYLSCAALAVAVYFGTTLVPGMTLETQALIAAGVGLAFWTIQSGLRARRVDEAYLRPLIHATQVMMAVAMAAAAVSVVLSREVTLAASSTFLLAGMLAVLIGLDEPRRDLATLAVVNFNLGLGLLISHLDARWRLGMEPAGFAVGAMMLAIGQGSLGDRLARRVERFGPSQPIGLYLRPILSAAFVQVALGIGLVVWQMSRFAPPIPRGDLGAIAASLAMGALAVILLLRVFSQASLAHLATALALGAWLALFELAMGGVIERPSIYAASGAAFAVLLLIVAEGLRSDLGRLKTSDPEFGSVRPVRKERLAAALPDFALVLSILAIAVAEVTVVDQELVWPFQVQGESLAAGMARIATLVIGAGAILWTTRFRRQTWMVYLGLVAAVASMLHAVGWRVQTDVPAWMTLTAAGASVVLWWTAIVWRGREGGEFYERPCRRVSSFLTAWIVPLAILSSFDGRSAFPPCLAALVVNVVASLLLSAVERRPRLTYRAVVSFVVATYLTLFNVGGPSPHGALVLSLAASLQAILFASVGIYCQYRPAESWLRIHARPLFVSALVLTVLALFPGYSYASAMLVASVSFLLLVKGFGSEGWIYPAVATLGWAVYVGVLSALPPDRLVTAALVGAYELWTVGVLVRRVNPALRHWLDLPGLDFDRPFFNSALLAALIATVLGLNEDWRDSAGLALNLAVLAVLMLKPYPHRGWVHAAVVLGTASVAFEVAPRLASPLGWLPVAMGVAIGWLLMARGVKQYEERLCRTLGVAELDYTEVPGLWSQAFFAIGGAAVLALVVVATLASVFGSPLALDLAGLGGWWSVVLALGLAGLFLVLEFGRRDRDLLFMGGHAVGLLLVWWIMAPSSPVSARWGTGALAMFLPLVTALSAIATAALGLRFPSDPSGPVPFWKREPEQPPCIRLSDYLWQVGFVLAMVAIVFTKGIVSPASIATMLAGSIALALLAIQRERVEAVYLAGLAWGASCVETALEVGWRQGSLQLSERAISIAVGAAGAMLTLGAVAAWLRQRRAEEMLARLSLPLEHVALLGAGLAMGTVGLGTIDSGSLSGVQAFLGVGVLVAVALFTMGLARQWETEWLVYAGQVALLGAYFVYRDAFPHTVATDAALLTLFGYIEFGLAEAMRRLRLETYARPMLFFSLAIPVLPLGLMIGTGRLDELNLFILFGVATFYSVACFRLQWRTLGYTSAVLYNAALWVLWSRIGWALADHPQFFLVPVGFSAILFAEVNRRDLGRETVNAIRGIGLILVYLSLAFPIWQFQSFGSWVTLLLLSLAGIFAGIGLRVQTFLWLGLVGFTLDVVYQLGRMGLEHTLAKWAIMLALGLLLILFVALNEKKRIIPSIVEYYEQVRQWE